MIVKNYSNVKVRHIFKHEFLYTTHGEDRHYFLSQRQRIYNKINEQIKYLFYFSGLNQIKQNVKLRVLVFWLGFKSHFVAWNVLMSMTEPWKYLEFIFCTKNLQQGKSFCKNIVKIQSISKLWDMRQLTLEERITVSKSLAVYKAINILLITKLRNDTIYLLYKIQKNFILQGKKAKIKNSSTALSSIAMKRGI